MWAAGSILVLVIGLAVTGLAARSEAAREADVSRNEFASTSAEIASHLQLMIRQEEDLIVSAGAFIIGNPHATQTEFSSWVTSSRVFERYPELEGFGYSTIVLPSELDAFAAKVLEDPSGPLAPDGSFQIIPPGVRPFYCLVVVGAAPTPEQRLPVGFDLCADARPGLIAARDSGAGDYAPITVDGRSSLSISIPIYRDGVIPSTVGERARAFLGWLGMSVSPGVLLANALEEETRIEASMTYDLHGSTATFRSGDAPEGASSITTDLHNGWTVKTSGDVAAAGVFAHGSAIGLLGAGISLSVALALLVWVLATSRARALRLVVEKTDELRQQALHDALTGLPNRALIMDRIEGLLTRNRRSGTAGAAMFVDLDGFKDVNDTLGHAAGDRLLQAVSARLIATLRDSDTIGRMGGDEFVVLIDGTAAQIAPELVAERLLDVMRQPFELEGIASPIVVTASIGIAIGDHDDPGDMLRDADVALYRAKAAGRDRYQVFRPDMEEGVQHRYQLECDLRAAVNDDQLRLAYQPIYDLDDLSIIGVEALLRWDHPTFGEVVPDEFVPLLESSGQIVEVGHWVLVQACSQMQTWRARGSDLIVSVNVSGRQFERGVVSDHVRDALEVSGLDPGSLTIEVTETVLMRDVEGAVRSLRELKALGVQIAIDDFGTGYSTLAYLQTFPVDCLKIDRAFTDVISRSPGSDALVHTLVQLGKDLGLQTLAEGVETTGQLDHLRGEEVNQAQGFLLARPLDPETLETQLLEPLRQRSHGETRAGRSPAF